MENQSKENNKKPLMVLIIIPRVDNSGPVKGSLALSSGLKSKGIKSAVLPLSKTQCYKDQEKVDFTLCNQNSFFLKAKKLSHMVNSLLVNYQVITISYCLRPNALVVLAGLRGRSICSLRANEKKNYSMQYGVFGYILAITHYLIARMHQRVIVLNKSMLETSKKYNMRAELIENFIDEKKLTLRPRRASVTHFIFVGGLTRRKGILELLDVAARLKIAKIKFKLTVLGDGPLKKKAEEKIFAKELTKCVTLRGNVPDPMVYLKSADVFVLPSYSEGTSRAAMEALYVGLPCIMREVDSNDELISDPTRGYLFASDAELFYIMKKYAQRNYFKKKCLLKKQFRQTEGIRKHLIVINEVLDDIVKK